MTPTERFRLLVRAALADGSVRPDEGRALAACAARLGLSPVEVERAFEEAARGPASSLALPAEPRAGEELLRELVSVVSADGRISPEEELLLMRVARDHGVERSTLRALLPPVEASSVAAKESAAPPAAVSPAGPMPLWLNLNLWLVIPFVALVLWWSHSHFALHGAERKAHDALLGRGFLLMMGCMAAMLSLARGALSMASSSWPTVKGRIVLSETYSRKGVRMARIEYEYVVDRRLYRKRGVNSGGEAYSSLSPYHADAQCSCYPHGKEVDVHYWPRAPWYACLEHGADGFCMGLAIALGCVAFSVCLWPIFVR